MLEASRTNTLLYTPTIFSLIKAIIQEVVSTYIISSDNIQNQRQNFNNIVKIRHSIDDSSAIIFQLKIPDGDWTSNEDYVLKYDPMI